MKKILLLLLVVSLMFGTSQTDISGDTKETLVRDHIEYTLNRDRVLSQEIEMVTLEFFLSENYDVLSVSINESKLLETKENTYSIELKEGNYIAHVEYSDGSTTQFATIDIKIDTFKTNQQRAVSSTSSYLSVTKSVNEVPVGSEIVYSIRINIPADDYGTYNLHISMPSKYSAKMVGSGLKVLNPNPVPGNLTMVSTHPRSTTGGVRDINFDVVITTDAGLTPNNYDTLVDFILLNNSGVEVSRINHSVKQKVLPFTIIPKVKIGSSAYYDQDGINAFNTDLGMASELGSKVTTGRKNYLTPVHYRFEMVTTSNVLQGIRNFQKITSEFTLPVGAYFDPNLPQNLNWRLSPDGLKVTQVSNIPTNNQRLMTSGKANVGQSIRTDILYDLVLIFPNYDTNISVKLDMNVTLEPIAVAGVQNEDINDPMYIITKTIEFKKGVKNFTNPLSTIQFKVAPISNVVYDYEDSKRLNVSTFRIDMSNLNEEAFKISSLGKLGDIGANLGSNTTDYRLPISEHMRISKITIKSPKSSLSNNFSLSLKRLDNTSNNISNINLTDDDLIFNFQDHFVDFVITPNLNSDLYLFGGKNLVVEIEYIFTKPEISVSDSLPDKTKVPAFMKNVYVNGNYVNDSYEDIHTAIRVNASSFFKFTIPVRTVTVSQNLLDLSQVALSSAGSETKAVLMNTFMLNGAPVGFKIKGLTIVNWLPQGVEFDVSRIEFRPAPSVASAFLEPVAIQSTVVVKNYLNSGKNAVIITLNDLTLSKNIVNQSLGELRVPVNFTIYANKQTSFKNYVYVDNSSDFILDKSFSKFTTDSEGVTGSTSNNVYAFVNDIVFNPVKELLSIVRGSGYLDNGALLLGRDSEFSTEVGKPTLLNFTLINNKDLADTGGSYQNLKILGLVPKINNNISIESKDYTTTNTRLVGLLENAKENTNQNHYFDIFYTYKEFVNTSGQDINSLQAYAASYLDGLTPSDLIKPSTRSTIDYSRVQSIVLIQKQGTTFLSDNRISFDMNFIADSFNTNDITKNYFGSSFFVSTEPGRATLANTAQTNVESYTISGKAYFDSNNNGTFEVGDKVLSNKKVEITHHLTSGSKTESVYTDADGNYFLRVYESGTYSVSMVNANHYETKYDLGSTLTQISPNVNLSLTNKDVNIDVVTNLKGNVLRLTNQLLDHEGIIVTTNAISEIDYILNINGYPYNGVAINEANEEVTVVNGVLSMKFGEILRVPSLGQQTTYLIRTADMRYDFSSIAGTINSNMSIDLTQQVKKIDITVNTIWNGMNDFSYYAKLTSKNLNSSVSMDYLIDQASENLGIKPKSDIYGLVYEYSLSTLPFNDIRTDITNVDGRNFNVVHTQLKDVVVNLNWVGGLISDHEATISLYADGKLVSTKNNVFDQATWEDLPVNDSDGKRITYSVKQNPLINFNTTILGLTITNVLVEDLEIDIVWYGSLPSSEKSIIHLFRDGNLVGTEESVNKSNLTFSRMPVFDNNGKPYIYTIEYTSLLGFRTEIKDFTISNYALQDISIKTIWLGDQSSLPPTTISLYKDDVILESKSSTLGSDTVFTGLDIENNNGLKHAYSVSQNSLANYKTVVDGHTITNTPIAPLKLSVEWVGGPQLKPDINVTLNQNGLNFDTQTLSGVLDYTWKNLEMFDQSNSPIIYSVSQDPITNYVTTIDGFKITNTFVSPLIDLDVNVKWIGGPPSKSEVNVTLYKDGFVVNSKLSVDDKVKWTGMSQYDSDGREIIYEIKSSSITNYVTSIDGLNVTNVYKSPVRDVNVLISWIGIKSDFPTITISLLRRDSSPTSRSISPNKGDIVFKDVVINGGVLNVVWNDLPIYDNNGKMYDYYVVQNPLTNFTTVIEGLKIINTIIRSNGGQTDEVTGPITDVETIPEIDQPKENDGVPGINRPSDDKSSTVSNEEVEKLPITGVASSWSLQLVLVFLGLSLITINKIRKGES